MSTMASTLRTVQLKGTPMSTTLGYTIFYVTDVEATLDFFTAAFGFERKMLTPENDYGELATGETPWRSSTSRWRATTWIPAVASCHPTPNGQGRWRSRWL